MRVAGFQKLALPLLAIAFALGLTPMFAFAAPLGGGSSADLQGGSVSAMSNEGLEITGIAYERAADFVLYENYDGYYEEGYYDDNDNWVSQEWFYYFVPQVHEGDTFTIETADGAAVYKAEYVENVGEMQLILQSGEGDETISADELEFNREQSGKHPWTVGGQNTVTVSYNEHSCTFDEKIVENPVKSIKYTRSPNAPTSVYQFVDQYESGEWIDDGDGEGHEVLFDCYAIYHELGDQLVVNGTDVYEYREVEVQSTDEGMSAHTYYIYEFVNVNNPNDVIETGEVSFSTGQSYENQWEVGKTYDVTVGYFGSTDTFKVKVEEDPVKSIEFTPAKPFKVVDSDLYRHDVYEYDDEGTVWSYLEFSNSVEEGDTIVVEYADGSKVTYTYSLRDDRPFAFADDNGNVLPQTRSWVQLGDNQSASNEWHAGTNTALVVVSYMGRTCEIPIEVIAPYHKLSYSPSQKTTILTPDEDPGDVWINRFDYGDILEIVKEEGQDPITYVYGYTDEQGEGFINAADDDDVIYYEDLDLVINDGTRWWSLGDNTVTLRYMGAECTYSIEVVQPSEDEYSDLVLECAYSDIDLQYATRGVVYWYDDGTHVSTIQKHLNGQPLKFKALPQNDAYSLTTVAYKVDDGEEIPLQSDADGLYTVPASASGKLTIIAKSELVADVDYVAGTMTFPGTDLPPASRLNLDIDPFIVESWGLVYGGSLRETIEIQNPNTFDWEYYLWPDSTTHFVFDPAQGASNLSVQLVPADAGTLTTTTLEDGGAIAHITLSKPATLKVQGVKQINAPTLSTTSLAYTGKAVSPGVTVKDGTKILKNGTDYTVSYKNNTNVGTATVTVTGKGTYTGSKSATFKITKAKNTITGKAKVTSNQKVKNLKKKAAKIALPKMKASFGAVKWSVAAKDKKKVLSLKNGKVVVKKGAKKKTYTIKLKASVAGTANYAAASKTVTVTVKVK